MGIFNLLEKNPYHHQMKAISIILLINISMVLFLAVTAKPAVNFHSMKKLQKNTKNRKNAKDAQKIHVLNKVRKLVKSLEDTKKKIDKKMGVKKDSGFLKNHNKHLKADKKTCDMIRKLYKKYMHGTERQVLKKYGKEYLFDKKMVQIHGNGLLK